MAWKAEQALLCPGCGEPRDETMADERAGPVPDYNARSLRCRACHARETTASAFAGHDDPDPTAGVYWSVSKNGTG